MKTQFENPPLNFENYVKKHKRRIDRKTIREYLKNNVVDGNLILAGGFHAHVVAGIVTKPRGKAAQIASESRKAFGMIGSNAVGVGRGNTGNDKGFVDIDSAIDRINNFKHSTSPH